MLSAWLESLLLKSARQIATADKAIFQFENVIRKALFTKPIQEWEAGLWARGLKCGLIRMEGYFFRIGIAKRSCLSFFIRNEQGLHVGLRRESITQAATYATLITDFGYPRERTRFETGWMDVAVFDEAHHALIYAENKAAAGTLKKLCAKLSNDFRDDVPFPEQAPALHDDALMKAQHIWRHKPKFFWGVSPTLSQSYRVEYSRSGFHLCPAESIPSALEWESVLV